jgi:hypothetical protein
MKLNLKAILATVGVLTFFGLVMYFAISYPAVAFPVLTTVSVAVMSYSLYKAFDSIFKRD